MTPTLVALRQPGGVLGRVVADTLAEVASLAPLAAPPPPADPHVFCAALRAGAVADRRGVALIAEVKPASPSRGPLLARAAVPHYVAAVAEHASAISVLVDRRHFAGGFDLVAEVRRLTPLPLLAKGFFVAPTQLAHARAAGADAVLLMASVLLPEGLLAMLAAARTLGLACLVEARDGEELAEILSAFAAGGCSEGCVAIGVNARNLETLEIDEMRARRLLAALPSAPSAPLRVAESGFFSAAGVDAVAGIADAVLVGSHLVAAADPAAAARALGFTKRGLR